MSTEKKNEEPQEEIAAESGEELSSEAVEQEQELELEQEKSLEEQLQAAEDESVDLRDRILRMAADFENYKKRMERERGTMLKYAGESIFRELLPVVDNLERAITQGVVDGVDAENNLSALLEGVQLTLKSLSGTLEKFEVRAVSSIGELFDPNVQEALTMEASDTVPANHVLTEFEKGYRYKDRLLRAARVVVSSGKAES